MLKPRKGPLWCFIDYDGETWALCTSANSWEAVGTWTRTSERHWVVVDECDVPRVVRDAVTADVWLEVRLECAC